MASFHDYSQLPPPWPEQLNECPVHRYKYKFISLDECNSPNLIFKCKKCYKEPNEKIINVSEFMYSTDRYIFDYLPEISDQLKKQIISVLNRKSNNRAVEVKEFFEELQSKVIEAIQDIEKQIIQKVIKVDSYKDRLRCEYEKLIKKQEIKQIIENKKSLVDKSNDIKNIIVNTLKNQNMNRSYLEELIKLMNEDIQQIKETELINCVSFGLQNMLEYFRNVKQPNQKFNMCQ